MPYSEDGMFRLALQVKNCGISDNSMTGNVVFARFLHYVPLAFAMTHGRLKMMARMIFCRDAVGYFFSGG
tara:strand:- start:2676 stop:2885 length:210 start_codon:yes stop_codon:yes gene_type:complete